MDGGTVLPSIARSRPFYERPSQVTMMTAMFLSATVLVLLVFLSSTDFAVVEAGCENHCFTAQHWDDHSILCHALERLHDDDDPQQRIMMAQALHDFAARHHQLVDIRKTSNMTTATAFRQETAISQHQQQQLPIVFAHGMGDSCFNNGMNHIVTKTSSMLNHTYAVCIPTADTQADDTTNGYFLNMDASVDVFATKIRTDPNLQHGFHAIGFSQGNNIIRGYIAKYNTPTVHTFVSINGVNAGVGAVPYCIPDMLEPSRMGFSMCDFLMEQASRAAYTEFAQSHSFQANYWRDPRPSAAELYHQYSQLAVWNNEAASVNETLKENYGKTQKFVWIMASDDEMVWPKEGEQWGAPDPADPFHNILPREQTEWYQKDLFGLKTAEEAGKNSYETFPGNHLQFTEEDYDKWIDKYIRQQAMPVPV